MPGGDASGHEGRDASRPSAACRPDGEVRCTRRVPAARHREQVAGDPVPAAVASAISHAAHAWPPERALTTPASSRAPAPAPRAQLGGVGRGSTSAATSSPPPRRSSAVRQPSSCGEHHRARARAHGEAVEIGADRAGQHDAGPVVVAEHQRPLDRAGGQHAPPGHDLPEALARQVRRRLGQMVADPLDRAVGAAVVDAEHRGAPQDADVRQARRVRPPRSQPTRAPAGRRSRPARPAAGRRARNPPRTGSPARRPARRRAPPSARPGRRRSPARRNGRALSRRCPDPLPRPRGRGRRRGGSSARRPAPRTRPAT